MMKHIHDQPFRIAHLSDSHLCADPKTALFEVNPYERLSQLIQALNQHHYDAIFITGDISEDGSMTSYEHFKKIIRHLNTPVYCIPGNHDKSSNLNTIIHHAPNLHTLGSKLTLGHWELFWIDTVLPGEAHGGLLDDDVKRLRSFFKTSQAECIGLIMHHQPVPVGTPYMDKLRLFDYGKIHPLIINDGRTKLIMFGHVHNAYEIIEKSENRHITYSSAPSTSFQFSKGGETLNVDSNYIGYKEYLLYPAWVETRCVWQTCDEPTVV